MEKIICVGKNYLKHAKELGDAVPTEPVYFIKPPSTLYGAESGTNKAEGGINEVELRRGYTVHHEIELVFRVEKNDGHWEFTQFTFGLDLTLRDLQASLKKNGQPWEKAKVFKNSAILGPWEQLTSMDSLLDLPFELIVNGETRQKGMGRDMRWKPQELLEDIQKWFPLKGGDVLFTGTPEGVGPLVPGDKAIVRAGQLEYHLKFV